MIAALKIMLKRCSGFSVQVKGPPHTDAFLMRCIAIRHDAFMHIRGSHRIDNIKRTSLPNTTPRHIKSILRNDVKVDCWKHPLYGNSFGQKYTLRRHIGYNACGHPREDTNHYILRCPLHNNQ